MYDVIERDLRAQATVVAGAELTVDEIKNWIGAAYARVLAAVSAAGGGVAGPPFARYRALDRVPGAGPARFEVEAGFPVAEPLQIPFADDVRPSSLPGGRAAVTVHVGRYDEMEPAYEALEKWVAGCGGSPEGPPWEVYLSEPTGDPAQWRTEIVQPFT
jgi:hypothetical protein